MILSPSLLAADAGYYAREIQEVYENGAQYLHIDCMDGHFVPNLGFGPDLIRKLRKYCPIFFDVHLMFTNPAVYYQAYIDAGADAITVHVETGCDLISISESCKRQGILFGIAVKPSTDIKSIIPVLPFIDILLVMAIEPGFGGQKFKPSALEKIQVAYTLREQMGASYKISIDGGVDTSLVKSIRDAGADCIVAGSAVFGATNRKQAVEQLMKECL